MLGPRLSEIYNEIAGTLWEFEADFGLKPNFTDKGFESAVKIFSSALMDKIFDLQEDEDIDIKDRMEMATAAGTEIHKLVKTYTGLNTKNFYRYEEKEDNT